MQTKEFRLFNCNIRGVNTANWISLHLFKRTYVPGRVEVGIELRVTHTMLSKKSFVVNSVIFFSLQTHTVITQPQKHTFTGLETFTLYLKCKRKF